MTGRVLYGLSYRMSTTTIRIVTEPEEFERLKEVWDSVLRECKEDSSICLTHEWIWNWNQLANPVAAAFGPILHHTVPCFQRVYGTGSLP